MGERERLIDDPAFRRLLIRRSRWRWGLSGFLIGAYLAWAVGGIYFAQIYAEPLPGSAIPAGIAAGLLIIALSIILSIAYVRIVNRLEADEIAEQDRRQ